MGWIGFWSLYGTATLGDIALFYQAFNRGQMVLRSLLGSLGEIYANCLFLEYLYEFIHIKPKIVDPQKIIPAPGILDHGIEFKDVGFRYPGTERFALRSFSLFVPKGQVVAIVGPNGAGKSTVLKLLCRLYDVETGSVEIDHTDIRNFCLKEIRKMVSVIFQEPVRYHATAAENIAMGDHQRGADRNSIEVAAKSAGAKKIIESLPQGFETPLGKSLTQGSELSGGEWQRIALSRAFLRKSDILVLDEPTSAMDSWAENEWLERFRALVKDRTAIIITHRFTTAMRADVIHVMDKGRIVESGTHAELLVLNRLYATSWSNQMKSESIQSKAP